MLVGCSSTLLSPRHRSSSETSAQFQSCHFPSMSIQRLDLPCTFAPKNTSRSQPIRPVGLSIEKPIEAETTSCSLKQTSFVEVKRESKNELWDKGKSLKRFAEHGLFDDESCMFRAKRKRGIGKSDDFSEFPENLSLGQLGSGDFWFQPSFQVPQTGLNPPESPLSLSCSGEEERDCFVPRDVISPPSSSNPGTSTESPRSLGLRISETASDLEIGHGFRPPNLNEGPANVVVHGDQDHEDHDGFELISLLVGCVEEIRSKNIAGINHFIAKLGDLASPRGSPISRLVAYFTEALALRVSRLWPHIFRISLTRELDQVDEDSGNALRLLNQVTPIPKFIHFTSNEIILKAFEGKERVHIIDFDIKQGLQWPSLFHSLASRSSPPTHVRITGIGESKQDLNETGDRLAGFAEALNLPFEFHPVVDKLEDVRLWMLHVKERESVAVNCIFQLHKILYDGDGRVVSDFLGLIRSINPEIVVIAEQESDHNEPILEKRLSNSLKYYSALFDSIDYSLPLDIPERIKIEDMFGHEIRNIIACEGKDRLERHESFGKWRILMEKGGLRCLRIGERELLQSRMLLKMYSCENFSVEMKKEQDGSAITLCWLDQPLYTVSAWAHTDVSS